MRSLITFPCEGEILVGSLDHADETNGLLIVSGGNEPRMGAHRGMALLATRIAAQGWPVFRFDRRGIGDSSGENGGWASSAPDLAAAAAAFCRAAPQITRLVGFGNCDAATALALFGKAAGVDALVLANPWVVERSDDGLPPSAAIRARYAERLCNPRSLLKGGDPRKLIKGLLAIARPRRQHSLAGRLADNLAHRTATIVLARGDATAIAYADATRHLNLMAPVVTIDSDSHSFASAGDAEALERVIVASLYSAASANFSNSAA